MLIPVFLIQACGRSPGEMGWLLAPLGLGMLVTYPSMGALTGRFGVRRLAAAGAMLALLATLPFVYLALRGYDPVVLVPALFLRGMGQSAIGAPSITAAYASVERRDLPMATTSLNIVQRLGGPTLTTLCTLFLAWRLRVDHAAGGDAHGTAYAWAFGLLCVLHASSFVTALRLPLWSAGAGGRRAAPASNDSR
jgi:MFS family permease